MQMSYRGQGVGLVLAFVFMLGACHEANDAGVRGDASIDAPNEDMDGARSADTGLVEVDDAALEGRVEIRSPTPIEGFVGGIVPEGTVFAVVVSGDTLHASGEASGGRAPYDYRWLSDRDGVLGLGAESDLAPSEGDHMLMLEAVDADGIVRLSEPLPLHVLPLVFDWSHVRRPSAPPAAGNWMTPVDSQGACGSCWAMASVAAAEAQLNIQAGDPNLDIDLSQQDVIDCDSRSLGCRGGGTEQTLDGYMREVGVPLERCVPFVGRDDVCRESCTDGSMPIRYRVADTVHALTPPGTTDHSGVRTWMQYQLVHHGPIPRSIVNMLGYDPVTHRCEARGGDHYVVVTGYDHAAGLWILKNSWGPRWNGDGYFEVAYDHCAVDTSATIIEAVLVSR